MAEIIIGERVINKREESGVIVYFDDKYINIQYNDRLGKLLINAFEEGYIKYENAELQNKVDSLQSYYNIDKAVSKSNILERARQVVEVNAIDIPNLNFNKENKKQTMVISY